MGLFIGFLTVLLIFNSLLLILLVMIQLPKKEAGAGMAFGGGTTDALFGAGSGNALTKITKWLTVFFLVLTLTLSLLQTRRAAHRNRGIVELMGDKPAATMPAKPVAPAPLPVPPPAPATPPSPAK